MTKPNETDDILIGTLPHDFEFETSRLITENYAYTLRGIQQAENETINHLQTETAEDDPEAANSAIYGAEFFFDELRRAATHTALVTLVTRLDHWARKFVKHLSLKTSKNKAVVREMEALNARLGTAPIDLNFFEELVTARDSVIHGDSQAKWVDHQGKMRHVASKYINDNGELDFTEQQLREAIENATMQVMWYDKQIATLNSK